MLWKMLQYWPRPTSVVTIKRLHMHHAFSNHSCESLIIKQMMNYSIIRLICNLVYNALQATLKVESYYLKTIFTNSFNIIKCYGNILWKVGARDPVVSPPSLPFCPHHNGTRYMWYEKKLIRYWLSMSGTKQTHIDTLLLW